MWHRLLSEAEVSWGRSFSHSLDRFSGLKVVSWSDDRDIMNRSQNRKVVQRMVGRAQRAVADARTDPDNTHRPVRVTDIVLDLLERARGQETSGRNREHIFAGRGEPGRDPHQILLRDANLNNLPRGRFGERR